jgi:hypothetical protein
VSALKTELAQYINDLAVQRGDFTLTSGKKASFYIDLRQVSLDHRVAPLIGDVMLELLSEFPEAELVGGLTMGADPIASAIMHRAVIAGRDLDAFVVRKPQWSRLPWWLTAIREPSKSSKRPATPIGQRWGSLTSVWRESHLAHHHLGGHPPRCGYWLSRWVYSARAAQGG